MTIERLEIDEIDGDRAVVAVTAERHYDFDGPRGSARDHQVVTYDGPVLLERSDGEWRVVDYRVAGRNVTDAVRLALRGSQEHDGVAVRATAAFLGARRTFVILAVENQLAHPLRIRLGAVRIRRWRGAVVARRDLSASTTTLVGLQANAAVPLDTERLELALLVADDASKATYPFHFPVDLDGGPEQPPAPAPSRLPVAASVEGRWPNGLRFLVFAVGVFALLAATAQWAWIGLLALAYGAMAIVFSARRPHHLGARWWLSAGAVLIALGVLVLSLTGWDLGQSP